MTFDPKQFLILAKFIMDDSDYDEETRYRTAVGRAYYAAHLVSKKTFEDIGVKFPIEDDKNMGIIHMMVIDHLLKINDPIGRMLKSLRKIRNKADYNMDWKFDKRKSTDTFIHDNVKDDIGRGLDYFELSKELVISTGVKCDLCNDKFDKIIQKSQKN